MPVSRLKFESLPHAIFLQRVYGPESATTLEARLGQGAFLALRLVDLLASDRAPVSTDAFHYQWVATDRFCRELHAAATEGAHVHRSEEHTSELQSQSNLVCRLLLEKKKYHSLHLYPRALYNDLIEH